MKTLIIILLFLNLNNLNGQYNLKTSYYSDLKEFKLELFLKNNYFYYQTPYGVVNGKFQLIKDSIYFFIEPNIKTCFPFLYKKNNDSLKYYIKEYLLDKSYDTLYIHNNTYYSNMKICVNSKDTFLLIKGINKIPCNINDTSLIIIDNDWFLFKLNFEDNWCHNIYLDTEFFKTIKNSIIPIKGKIEGEIIYLEHKNKIILKLFR